MSAREGKGKLLGLPYPVVLLYHHPTSLRPHLVWMGNWMPLVHSLCQFWFISTHQPIGEFHKNGVWRLIKWRRLGACHLWQDNSSCGVQWLQSTGYRWGKLPVSEGIGANWAPPLQTAQKRGGSQALETVPWVGQRHPSAGLTWSSVSPCWTRGG